MKASPHDTTHEGITIHSVSAYRLNQPFLHQPCLHQPCLHPHISNHQRVHPAISNHQPLHIENKDLMIEVDGIVKVAH